MFPPPDVPLPFGSFVSFSIHWFARSQLPHFSARPSLNRVKGSLTESRRALMVSTLKLVTYANFVRDDILPKLCKPRNLIRPSSFSGLKRFCRNSPNSFPFHCSKIFSGVPSPALTLFVELDVGGRFRVVPDSVSVPEKLQVV